MYLIRKIKDDGSSIDSYNSDILIAKTMLGSHRGLILDLNKPKGYASFEIVRYNP